ncbi:AraC family transcriptional regulator [Rapidithrix thailandica]|uniref:AraC family transcriptional regulator n=1 Tax=Rapidithrix thailandica TaxID=413964 RepID=A0AAW9SEP6_9BACT
MKKIPIRYIDTKSKKTDFSGSFNIRNLQNLFTGKDLIQELHRHDYFYLLALKKGSGKHEIDFTPYKVTDHTVYFMRPGQVHQLRLNADSTGYMMIFKAGFYDSHDNKSYQHLRKASKNNYYQLEAQTFRKLDTALSYIAQEFANQGEGYQDLIKANLKIIMIELLRQQDQHPVHNVTPYTQERLEEFLALLETHITQHKQVAHYADMLHLSPYQLNAITKAALGKTCSELINEYILLEAKRYLLATSNQVNQIAFQLGYEDVSYFIRFFKKQTGYSPEVFRHTFKKA